MLRRLFLLPITSLLVGSLLLTAIGRRPELIGRGAARVSSDETAVGFLRQWREAIAVGDWSRVAEAARKAGYGSEQLRVAGRRLGINGKQAREALMAWAKGVPGYDPAAGAAALAGKEVKKRDHVAVNAAAVGATSLVGMPPVLVGVGLHRRLRRRAERKGGPSPAALVMAGWSRPLARRVSARERRARHGRAG